MIKPGHAVIGSNDLARAKSFYDALLGSAHVTPMREHPSGGRIYGKDGHMLLVVLSPYDRKPATAGNGSMHTFSFDTPAEVDAFYAKAIALGAADEGPPGERAPGYYMSYFRDPDGNKLCAFNLS